MKILISKQVRNLSHQSKQQFSCCKLTHALGQIQALSIVRGTHDRAEPPSVALVRALEGV